MLHEISRFRNWLNRAQRGTRYHYHTGHLASDRCFRDDWTPQPQEPYDSLASEIYAAQAWGAVLLVQKRIANSLDGCEYFAISTGRNVGFLNWKEQKVG